MGFAKLLIAVRLRTYRTKRTQQYLTTAHRDSLGEYELVRFDKCYVKGSDSVDFKSLRVVRYEVAKDTAPRLGSAPAVSSVEAVLLHITPTLSTFQ